VAHCLRALREARASLPELARASGLSPAHLSKLFAAQIGVSVSEFRNRVGVERFIELYGDGTRLTLTAAALDAGFGSYPQFHRVFSEQMGYTPAEHRRRVHAREGTA
jgi:transcriptional regulator GlxA family with amidase domain